MSGLGDNEGQELGGYMVLCVFFRDQNRRLSHWGDGLVWNPNKNWQTKNSQGVTAVFTALLQFFFAYLKCWLIVFYNRLGCNLLT